MDKDFFFCRVTWPSTLTNMTSQRHTLLQKFGLSIHIVAASASGYKTHARIPSTPETRLGGWKFRDQRFKLGPKDIVTLMDNSNICMVSLMKQPINSTCFQPASKIINKKPEMKTSWKCPEMNTSWKCVDQPGESEPTANKHVMKDGWWMDKKHCSIRFPVTLISYSKSCSLGKTQNAPHSALSAIVPYMVSFVEHHWASSQAFELWLQCGLQNILM
jgi:hypothetical protein